MGEIKDAERTDGVLVRTHVGGQALIEGIMMRGRYNWAVAVRQPDGTIYTEEHDLASGKKKNSWMYWPIIRGCTALVESLALGYKALDISANHAYDFSEEDEKEATSSASAETTPTASIESESAAPEASVSPEPQADAEQKAAAGEDGMPQGLMGVSMIIGLVLGIALFIVVPAVLANLIVGDYGDKTLLWNTVDGILRVVVFIAYIWGISRMKDIRRMFAYHGAEHQTIHCYEHGLPLTPENAARFPRLHVRCGTAFLIMTMIIAILVFTIVPVNAVIEALGVTNGTGKLLLVILSRIILAPLIAGISYEITVKWAGSHPENPLVKVVLWPGLQMQRLTTNVPDKGMLECAIAAMRIVLAREESEVASGNVAPGVALRPCDVADSKGSAAAAAAEGE